MKKLNFFLSVIIGGVFLYFAFKGVNLSDVWYDLKKANYLYILPAMGALAAYIAVRAYRWGLIFRPGGVPSYRGRLSSILIGIMVNNIFPAKLGEVARAFILGKSDGVNVSRTFGTIVLERVFDFLALLLFLVLIALASPVEREIVFHKSGILLAGFIATGAGFIGILFALLAIKFWTAKASFFAGKAAGIFSKKAEIRVSGFVNSFAEGLRPLNDPLNAAKIFIVSLGQWCLSGLMTYLIMLSFGITISPVSSFFVFIIVTLGVVIPPSPGGVGTTQFFATFALTTWYGIDSPKALSFALVSNILVLAVLTLAGWYFLVKESVKFADMLGGRADKEPV